MQNLALSGVAGAGAVSTSVGGISGEVNVGASLPQDQEMINVHTQNPGQRQLSLGEDEKDDNKEAPVSGIADSGHVTGLGVGAVASSVPVPLTASTHRSAEFLREIDPFSLTVFSHSMSFVLLTDDGMW